MLNRSIVLCVLFFVLGSYSKACSCAGFGPACVEAVSPQVSAVFLGTVVAISPSSGTPHSNVFGDMLDVALSVQESYKGASSKRVVVTTASSEAACGFPFKKEEQYVVYGNEYEGKLFTSICQRTLPAKAVEKDLSYLRKLATADPTVFIGGSYKKYTFDPNFVPKFTPSIMDHYRPPEEEYRAMAPMTGEEVTLTAKNGEQTKTKINADGRFVFEDLAPGVYSISVSVPPGLLLPIGYAQGLRSPLDALEVLPKGCAEVTFRAQPDGRITGRIFNEDGLPLANVEVIVWNAAEKFEFYRGAIRGYNKEDGSFDLGPLPPGEYILGAYVWVLPQGFPAMADERNNLTKATLRYYSGATSPQSAKKIEIGFGQHVGNIELRIPFDPASWKNIKGRADKAVTRAFR
jgi:hypothetical protein